MRCSNCKTENPAGKKFCGDCGAPLANLCPKCGADNPANKPFCGDCGASLGASAAPSPAMTPHDAPVRVADVSAPDNIEGERKTVTALFADIKGSTEMMEDLDPEQARAIIDPALKLMIDAAHRYDGYVVQSTFDGIFALFGAPVAREDHPQRSLFAALRMQEELRRYSAKVVADGGTPIQGRIGINTGEVVVRSIYTGAGHVEYTPIGHMTNLASRMQTAAPVGSIAVTEATRKLCEGYFTLKPLGATKVKGVSEPVNVYEVTGLGPLRTRLQRAAGRGLTKFVGREREMEAMSKASELAGAGRGQIVAAMAEAGTGKSRLFFEFKAKNQSGWMVLETISVSHGKASAYFPVIDLLHNYFKITGDDDERSRRAKIIGAVLALDRALEDTLPFLLALLGIVEGVDPLTQMDGQVKKRRTLDAIKRILLRESLNQPLLVIFEDLHWIDEETQAFLNLLADSIANAKILLLVNYRPECSHQWNSKTYYTQLRLDPLGKESADAMLSALLGDNPDLGPLKRVIIDRTEGNPFFMEETVQVLLDEGALVRDGGMHLTKPIRGLKIPPTVQGILAARIDRLASDAKDLLQTLSVIGREFPMSLIRSMVLKSDDEISRPLSDLQLGEFIYEHPAVGETEYIFKHALTQEVAYNSLLIERRKLLHERAGLALESLFAEQLEDHLDELAHHYGHSGNPEKAVEYLGRAGQRAAQRSAYGDAIRNLTVAIALLTRLPDSTERIRQEALLQLGIGPAFLAVKGWAGPEAERAYTRVRELCALLGDPPELFPGLFGLWSVYFAQARLQSAYDLSEQLAHRSQSVHDPALAMYGELAFGITSFFMGKFVGARQYLETSISHYHRERHRQLTFRYGGLDAEVWGLSYAAFTLWNLGYPNQASKRSAEAVQLAQGLSHPFSLAMATASVAILHRQGLAEVRVAQESAEGLIALCAEHGLSAVWFLAVSLRGWAMARQGRHQKGIEQLQEGLAVCRAAGAEANLPLLLCLLAEACLEADRVDDGLRALTEALAAADQHEIRNHQAETYRLKGELLLKQDESNAEEAAKCFEHAIEVSRKQHAKAWELRATTSLSRLLLKQGNRVQARAMLADIYGWFTEGFDTADLKDAKARLDELAILDGSSA